MDSFKVIYLKGATVAHSSRWMPLERDLEQRNHRAITPLQSKFSAPHMPVQANCNIRVWDLPVLDWIPSTGPLSFIDQPGRQPRCCPVSSPSQLLFALAARWPKKVPGLPGNSQNTSKFSHFAFLVSRCAIPFLISRDAASASGDSSVIFWHEPAPRALLCHTR